MTPEAVAPRPIDALWRTLFRWESGKIVPPVAVRNTIGFALAFIIGALISGANAGVLAGLGALNVSYSDGLDPYGARARRMMLASVLCGIAVSAGALSGQTNTTAVIVAALSAFAAGMLVALGQRAGDLGVIMLVTLIVFAARPLALLPAIESGLVAIGGGLLQTGLSIALWPVKPYQPERKIISELYRAIAEIAEGERDTSTAPPVSRQISEAQAALASLARDHDMEAERYVFLLNQSERIRLSLIHLTELYGQIAREPSSEPVTSELAELLQAAARTAREIGAEAAGAELAAALNDFERAANRFRSLSENKAVIPAGSLLAEAVHEADALAGRIRAAAATSSGSLTRKPAPTETAPEPWYLRFPGRIARLRANLSLRSTVFRHALRLAVCLGFGDALGRAISLQRTYWIPMTIAIVLKPDFTSTFSRGILRIAGTFAGLLLATALFRYVHVGIAADIALMTVFMFLLRWVGPANYGIFVTVLSGLVVLLIATTGVDPYRVIAARAENTAIGGALALLAYAVWPTWEKTQAGIVLADMIDCYRDYFDTVIRAYGGSGRERLDRVRLAARLARSNAEASVDRMAAEPGTTREQIAITGALMASSHSLVHGVMTLESGLYHTRPLPMRPATREFAALVNDALEIIAGWLRGDPAYEDRTFPDLRRAHTAIVRSSVEPAERYTLVDRETDRITTSANTLAELVRRWREITKDAPARRAA